MTKFGIGRMKNIVWGILSWNCSAYIFWARLDLLHFSCHVYLQTLPWYELNFTL